MTTDVIGKVALILCDYDALYAAIELKLSSLPDVQVTRLDLAPTEPHRGRRFGRGDHRRRGRGCVPLT
jgi:hypothetical protein